MVRRYINEYDGATSSQRFLCFKSPKGYEEDLRRPEFAVVSGERFWFVWPNNELDGLHRIS